MHTDSLTTSRRLIGAALLVSAASALLLLTGCAQIHQQVGDAWSVTYEVSVDVPAGAALTGVRIEGAEQRGDAPSIHKTGSVTTETPSDGSATSVWRHESVVMAEDRAMVRATAPVDATATCRVLLDGERVIAEKQGKPGGTVTCSVATPKFGS